MDTDFSFICQPKSKESRLFLYVDILRRGLCRLGENQKLEYLLLKELTIIPNLKFEPFSGGLNNLHLFKISNLGTDWYKNPNIIPIPS